VKIDGAAMNLRRHFADSVTAGNSQDGNLAATSSGAPPIGVYVKTPSLRTTLLASALLDRT
jgi:hypothetical protein